MPLKFPPKFGDVMWCFHITFMQRYLLLIGDFELYIIFANLAQWVSLQYTYLNISLKILPSVWRCQWMPTIQLYAKIQWCSLKNLSVSTSFSFWSSLVICTATLFYFALVHLSFFLLIVLPTKPLSPGDWTHWRILSACNGTFFFLSKTEVLQNLH